MSKKSFAQKAKPETQTEEVSAETGEGTMVETQAAPAAKAKKQPKDWLPGFLAKLAARGATRETLTAVPGKNAFVLKHNGKTVTWFRKETDLARVLDAMPA